MTTAAPVESVNVDDAGLVLLWPFMHHLLSLAELVEPAGFVSTDARHRAVSLLRYVATGREVNEPQGVLALSKLLCGLAVDETVTQQVERSEAERDLVADLLDAVCRQWHALQATSADGLRETFILRQGRVGPLGVEPLATVRVAAGPFDMLLDTVPWPYSIVQLGWMDRPLSVEWRSR